MQARHWIVGAVALLVVVGAYLLGDHAHTLPVAGNIPRPHISATGTPPPPVAANPSQAATGAAATPATDAGFSFASVEELARARAEKPYEAAARRLPAAIAHLTYDQYQSIRFRHADALWRNQSLYEVQFFHRGFNFDRAWRSPK